MRIAVYPGSFDPVTSGHLDIIKRASRVFDEVIVAVLDNAAKNPLFTKDERVEMIKTVTSDINNVCVESFTGLLVDFMKKKEAKVIIKGLRAVSDFEYEFQMALLNHQLNPEIETFFMMTSSEYSYVSSSVVKDVAKWGGNLSGLVPDEISNLVIRKSKSK